jgi:PAS domain S-box-containing protein
MVKEVRMSDVIERRSGERHDSHIDISFAVIDRSHDLYGCIENFSNGGMLLKSEMPLLPGDVIQIRRAEGRADVQLAWGDACEAEVIFCHTRPRAKTSGYHIGVRYHSTTNRYNVPQRPGSDFVAAAPIGCTPPDQHGKVGKSESAFVKRCSSSHRQPRPELALDASNSGVWEFNPHTFKDTRYNDGWFAMLGFGPDELPHTAETWTQLMHPDDLEYVQVKLKNHIEGKEEYSLKFRMKKKNGSYCWIHSTGRIVEWDSQGQPKKMIGIHTDITKFKEQEEALKESEQNYRCLVESSSDWIWEVNEEGRYTYSSPQVEKILGYSPEEIIDKRPFDFLVSEETNRIQKIFSDHIKSGKPITHLENINLHKAGHRVVLETNGVPIIDETGHVKGYRGIDRDITERVEAEADNQRLQSQLAQAHKMESVGRLAGGVAHDFNNMLTIILGNTEMILSDMPPESRFIENLQEIHKAAARSANLTRQLLAFARKQTISPKILNLNEALEEMCRMLKRLIGEDINLSWLPSKKLWPVKIDPSQVDQILANLCVNARDAIKGVGKITIETKNTVFDEPYCLKHVDFHPGEFVMIAVSDNGCGMDTCILDNIFEPFFTTKEVEQGSGLGLATVYGIVKQNGGFLNVYSEPEKGTTFKIYLPRHLISVAAAPDQHLSEPIPWGNETVLLVEDDESILRMTKMLLERLNYTVLDASSPVEAIRIAENHLDSQIQLLLTDVVMPEMNGRDLAEALSKLHPELKCLFMSGYTANMIAHHGVLDRGVQFISKPFSIKELGDKLRDVLDSTVCPLAAK